MQLLPLQKSFHFFDKLSPNLLQSYYFLFEVRNKIYMQHARKSEICTNTGCFLPYFSNDYFSPDLFQNCVSTIWHFPLAQVCQYLFYLFYNFTQKCFSHKQNLQTVPLKKCSLGSKYLPQKTQQKKFGFWTLTLSPFSEHYLHIYYLLATEALAKLPVPVCLNTGLLPTSNNFMHCS